MKTKDRPISHWGHKGGFTSRCSDMGVQWDFKANCGLRGRRWFPVAALIPAQSDEPWPEKGKIPQGVEFSRGAYRSRKCQHQWLIGDYLSVCSKCHAEVPHGMTVPAFGMTDEDFRLPWCKEAFPMPPPYASPSFFAEIAVIREEFPSRHELETRRCLCDHLLSKFQQEGYSVRLVTGKSRSVNHCWLEFHNGLILDPSSAVFKRPDGAQMPSIWYRKKPSWYYETLDPRSTQQTDISD